MARLKGGLITSNFDVDKRAPLDSRELVTKYEDLINPKIWMVNTTNYEALYNGLKVSVNEKTENMGMYFLIDREAITEENYNNYLAAKEKGEEIKPFFSMWAKLLTISDKSIADILTKLEQGDAAVTEYVDEAIAAIYKVEDGVATGALAEETKRAKQAEKENSDAIARIIGDPQAGIITIAELTRECGEHSKRLDTLEAQTKKHSTILVGIGDQSKGEEPTVIAYINKAISGLSFELPEATKDKLGVVKIDDKTIKINKDKQIYVAKITTDILEEGLKILVLNGGNEDLFNEIK